MRGKLGRPSQASQLVIAVIVLAAAVIAIANPQPSAGNGPTPSPAAAITPASPTPSPSPAASTSSTAPTATTTAPPPASQIPLATTSVAPTPTQPVHVATTAPTVAPTPQPSVPAGGNATLSQLLALLPTVAENHTGYSRDLFVHWIDADGDGCDTRREVLIDESLVPVTIGASCSLSGGSWVSLYDGLSFTDSSGMDIDHMVPLAEAWDSGASVWSADRRKRFANDLDVDWALIAVSASSNRSKGDRDPAEWLPPASSELCPYLADWLAVKVRWQLSVDTGERSALAGLIPGCPDTRRPVVLAP